MHVQSAHSMVLKSLLLIMVAIWHFGMPNKSNLAIFESRLVVKILVWQFGFFWLNFLTLAVQFNFIFGNNHKNWHYLFSIGSSRYKLHLYFAEFHSNSAYFDRRTFLVAETICERQFL